MWGRSIDFTTPSAGASGNKTPGEFTPNSIEGSYASYDKQGVLRPTVTEGEIIVRSNPDAATDGSLSGLNRDINEAREITKDKELAASLYVSKEAIDEVTSGFGRIRGNLANIKNKLEDIIAKAAPEQKAVLAATQSLRTELMLQGLSEKDLASIENKAGADFQIYAFLSQELYAIGGIENLTEEYAIQILQKIPELSYIIVTQTSEDYEGNISYGNPNVTTERSFIQEVKKDFSNKKHSDGNSQELVKNFANNKNSEGNISSDEQNVTTVWSSDQGGVKNFTDNKNVALAWGFARGAAKNVEDNVIGLVTFGYNMAQWGLYLASDGAMGAEGHDNINRLGAALADIAGQVMDDPWQTAQDLAENVSGSVENVRKRWNKAQELLASGQNEAAGEILGDLAADATSLALIGGGAAKAASSLGKLAVKTVSPKVALAAGGLSKSVISKLGSLADNPANLNKTVREIIRERGGNASNVRKIQSDMADWTLAEIASAAASGNPKAETAIKIIKQAYKKGQKY